MIGVYRPEKRTKRCERCGKDVPGKDYPPHDDKFCISCIERSIEGQKHASKHELAQDMIQTLQKAATGLEQWGGGGADIEAICDDIVDQFGGSRAFTTVWYEQLLHAMSKSPGSARVLQQFVSIARLANEASKRRRETRLDDLSDQQLQMEGKKMELEVIRMWVDRPDLRQEMQKMIHQANQESARGQHDTVEASAQPAD